MVKLFIFGSRKKVKKELEVKKKKLQKQLKGYDKAVTELKKEYDRVSDSIVLSSDEKQIQYNLLDDKLALLDSKIKSTAKLLDEIDVIMQQQ